ncbi:transglycosylase domain-containing protein [Flavobacteriaceae bacterium XHP0103]|uniref:transglycosylase domain-containing protein n=1 Tax=Marixanthotalea marina TaxID=2844359 RepID=UPI002989AFCE|nr:transglycosylase domain-containing protein [Marixanthotalea marina]MBU3823034.1 transglycosylase domain-containing protein [Marixanthotalea marina]
MLTNRIVKNKWFNLSLKIALSFFAILFIFYGSIYFGFWGEIPSKNSLESLKQSQATEILDANNQLIGKFYIYDRQSIKYENFPKHLIDALIATEDVRFYDHDGVDNKSLLRVVFKSILLSDDASGGGSTITLQLAKNLFGRKDYGFLSIVINKIKESIVATRIEKVYNKEDILTLYLNTVPFPDNTYGIESASLKFFNVHTKDLSISQAATLIGSLKANSYYNPRLHPEHALTRRNVVLNQMEKYGYIDTESALKEKEKPINLDYQFFAPNQGLAPYFRAEIKRQLDTILQNEKFRKPNGEAYDLYNDGLKVYTTLDNTLQQYAEKAMQQHMAKLQNQFEKAYGQNAPWLKSKSEYKKALARLDSYKKLKQEKLSEKEIEKQLNEKHSIELFSWDSTEIKQLSTLDSLEYYMKFLNAGMVSLDPISGNVRAYIGGIDYRFFQYDHVSQSKRQVGSTFKPIVYTTAIENGMKPCEYFPVKAITYTDVDDWTPTNASSHEEEDEDINYSLEYALSNSINTIAVKVLYEAGIPNVIDMAKAMGIKSTIESVPSIALGSSNLSVLELAKAYTSFVNESVASTPIFITKIEDKEGRVIASYEDLNPKNKSEKAFSDTTRQVMLEFMKATVNSGTAQRLRSQYQFKNDIAGKTGTTQDNKDGWFVAIMPKLVTVTWVGNDNQQIGFSNTTIGQGANSALPIFANYLQQINKDPKFKKLAFSSFETPSEDVLESLNCEPSRKDTFFERLFRDNREEKEFNEDKDKRGGFFSIFRRKKDK